MADKQRRSLFLLIVILILLIGCVGLVTGYLYVSQQVTAQFGPSSDLLSLTQRVIYPLELFSNRAKMTSPYNPTLPEQSFSVGQGESVSMVCIRLEDEGFIPDAELFRIYLVYSGLDRQLQSGEYLLSGQMSPMDIAADMLDATPRDAIVSILAGWRIEEVAASVAGSGLNIEAEAFINLAYNPLPEFFAYLPVDDAPSLEGFLFPGVYTIPREADAITVIETFLANFSANVSQEMLDGFARQGLTVQEAVTLASIIEKEAVVDDEKPLIASVFYNRLNDGMRLESDPTVQYALGYQNELGTWWKSPLSGADLGIESPYNTYQIPGLPPTPMDNPDLLSLQAVAFPAETPYYFFRAACDGSGRHNFAITYEEHLNNGCE
ncbi:MAG: endolytic transglycosylase MltG [Anaerolineaceae bacterium]|nr:endolytic transglycosylase MltG [Anaerolineaceae bacterium]